MGTLHEAWLQTESGSRVAIRGPLSFGRSSSNTIVLDSEKASRRHAIIHTQDEGEFWLVDLGSSNGTILNDRRIHSPVKLKQNDRITMGGHVFAFNQVEKADRDPSLTRTDETIRESRHESSWLLVADIESFTQLSRQLPGDRLAMLIGTWMLECKTRVENHSGTINKYLGDGFLAHWPDVEASGPRIAALLGEMQALCAKEPRFRIVLHLGTVSVSGSPLAGEELIGNEVNFIFRMEKLAGSLRAPLLLSEPANRKLSRHLPTRKLDPHQLKGFDDHFAFFVPH